MEARKLLLPTNVKVNIKTEIVEKITVIDKIKTEDHIKFLTKALMGHFVFYNLLPAELYKYIENSFMFALNIARFISTYREEAKASFTINFFNKKANKLLCHIYSTVQ